MGYAYIVASKRNGTLYVGVTSDLEKRIDEHRKGVYEGFSKKYGCKILVWYQKFQNIKEAIEYEKRLKGWKRKRKLDLIERDNINRKDLIL